MRNDSFEPANQIARKRFRLELDRDLARYRADGICLSVPEWKRGGAFVVCENIHTGIMCIFAKSITDELAVRDRLAARGFDLETAAGDIHRDRNQLVFRRPTEPLLCTELLLKLVHDHGDFVRYLGTLTAIANDGTTLGTIEALLSSPE